MNSDKHLKIIKKCLNKKSIDVIDLLGVMSVLIIVKDVFRRNSEVEEFIKNVLDVSFPQYVIKSRTLICARTNRILIEMEDSQITNVQKKLVRYLEEVFASDEEESGVTVKKNKKKNENEKLEKWLKEL